MFTQKETSLLQDAKAQEQLCVNKYKKCSAEACDEELKNLFSGIAENEQQHYNTITQLLSGTFSGTAASGSRGISSMTTNTAPMGSEIPEDQLDECQKKDKYLCTDTLSTEKHVSSIYNTSIFEFRDPQVRDTLNHIQKEEQNHGEQIYNYMASHGFYQAK